MLYFDEEKEITMQETDTSEAMARLQGFDDFVQQIMQNWKVQGLAVAIIKDGEVIFSQGFGKRDVAKDLDVTPQTLFPIASCTKAFTTGALAVLADAGKLDWDTPLRVYMPEFKLRDLFASERMTPRDLVSHRSGLPRHDMSWYNANVTRQELFERLQYLEPTKDFRSLWQYQNLMYMAAGYLVERITGQTWEEFVREHLFVPLDMTTSNFSIIETVEQASNFSHPYQEKDDEVKEMPFYGAQGAIGPAGAIVSCIDEMSHWVLMHMNKGKYNDKQIISSSQIAQMHSPQMIIPETGRFAELPYASYALGWFVTPYRGHPMVQHGGNIDGFSSLTSLFPHENVGVVVLTNMNASPVPAILTYKAFERLMSLDQIDWSTRFKKDQAEMKEAGKKGKEKTEADRVPDTQPSHELGAYVGDYENPGYGVIEVKSNGDELQATFNNITAPLKHYHYDIFELQIERFEMDLKASFLTNFKGDIDTLIVPLEVTASDIVFKRIASKEMTERSFLEQFTGEYELLGMRVIVVLKGENMLQVTVPGQPEYELEPYKGTEFRVKGISGFSLEFKRDDAGTVTEMLVTRPYGTFTAKKV